MKGELSKNKKAKQARVNHPASARQSNEKQPVFYYLFFIVIVTIVAYYPSLKNKFTNWDDGGYVVDNLDLRNFSFSGIKYQFSQYVMGNYHPLAMISLSLDYAFGKLNPLSYHITNLICHLINTLLVFRLLTLLFLQQYKAPNKDVFMAAAVGSILFGVHTLSVESVAWVSERKNLLYVMFFLCSLIIYIEYIKKNKQKYYYLSLFLFILSLLSKGTAVSLALTLPLTDYYFNRKLTDKKVLLEKVPYFILALVFGVVAVYAQHSSHALHNDEQYFFYERVLFAGYGLFQYLVRLVLPVDLSFYYYYPTKTNGLLPAAYYLYPLLALLIISAAIVYYRKMKLATFALLFFFVNIVMVLQVIPVGYAVMADRYTYLPSIGFFLIPGMLYIYFKERKTSNIKIYIGFITVYIISLIFLTQQQCKAWHDGLTLWDREIEHDSNSALAYKSRGRIKLDNNDNKGAYDDFDKAIKLNPKYGEAYNGRGMARGKMQDIKGALEDLDKAVTYYPDDELAWNNRGIAKSILNDRAGAIADFNKSIQLAPKFYNAYYNRALTESAQSNHEAAITDLTTTLKLNPDYTVAYFNRGLEKITLKDFNGAIEDLDIDLKSEKDNALAYYNRGIAKYNLNDKPASCEDLKTALNLGYAKADELIKMYCR